MTSPVASLRALLVNRDVGRAGFDGFPTRALRVSVLDIDRTLYLSANVRMWLTWVMQMEAVPNGTMQSRSNPSLASSCAKQFHLLSTARFVYDLLLYMRVLK